MCKTPYASPDPSRKKGSAPITFDTRTGCSRSDSANSPLLQRLLPRHGTWWRKGLSMPIILSRPNRMPQPGRRLRIWVKSGPALWKLHKALSGFPISSEGPHRMRDLTAAALSWPSIVLTASICRDLLKTSMRPADRWIAKGCRKETSFSSPLSSGKKSLM